MANETIDAVVKRQSQKSWGLEDANNPRELIWLPKSQCKIEWPSTQAASTERGPCKIEAPEWLLRDRGLV